ncbi:hypothetical protein RJ641_014419 [Dillenia turbinata]|uniref:Uncharacterized protein n=1 Tax=Dillenia turbinata TaxID=194707 RepID=A0AAN8UZU3_9MAGN
MPGPGPHMMYTLSTGIALTTLSNGKFSPHHSLTYSINAFFGPDIGSFTEWLTLTLGFAQSLGSAVHDVVHNPFYFVLLLGFPLSLLYSYLSGVALHKGLLDSASGDGGHSIMYTWIISTGWWEGRAPVNPDEPGQKAAAMI